ncbi:N-acetyltransferase GCN5 [candidate division WWE3 bacterium RAAC2_WWE3_1]|nr:N-acetyltransferase GCN5 [candidate division WWE3 bacterium RAAC2_WWE3_1]OGC67048.1 MAG: hypothetical protein A2364_00775 [candidate division WWE3 bacterium RIFOXYB1_FULL_43_12]
MKIRKATKKDIPKIRRGLLESWLSHVDNEPMYYNRDRVEKSDIDTYYTNAMDSVDSFVLIIEENGKFIGFGKADIQKIEPWYKEQKVLYIDDIYIEKEFRKKGCAKTLLQEFEKMAKTRDIKWIKARVYSFNEPAKKLNASFGFYPLYSEYFKII